MANRRNSGEALLISTALNSGADPASYGVTEDMLVAYGPQFRWIRSYPADFGSLPTPSVFRHAFPEFPFDPDADDIRYACEVVRRDHRKRQAIHVLTEASEHIAAGDAEEAVRMIQNAQFTGMRSHNVNVFEEDDDDFFCDYSEKPDAMSVPWPTLQKETGGIRRGDLWYVAARTGNGKSWNLGQFAAHALLEGRSVKFYSLEMPKSQVLVRMHVILGAALNHRVDHIAMRDRVYDPLAYRRLVRDIRDNVIGKLYIHDLSMGRVSPHVIAQDTDTDLVMVDYVGLMDNGSGGKAVDDWRSIASISNDLKATANANKVRVVAASQINREGDTVGLKPPKLKNLSQSDALGQDGDVILTSKQMGSVMVHSIEKNRHGNTGKLFYTRFLPNSGQFPEIDRDEAFDLADEEASA